MKARLEPGVIVGGGLDMVRLRLDRPDRKATPEGVLQAIVEFVVARKGGKVPSHVIREYALTYKDPIRVFTLELRQHGITSELYAEVLAAHYPEAWCRSHFKIPNPPVPLCLSFGVLDAAIRLRRARMVGATPMTVEEQDVLFEEIRVSMSTLPVEALAELLVQNGTLSSEWLEHYKGS